MLKKLKSLIAYEQKKIAAIPVISLHTVGQPQWTSRNYATLTREGFAANAIGYRCVRMISEAAGSIPLLVYEKKNELAEHPLKNLLQKPNPVQTGTLLIEAVMSYLLVSGNAYLEVSIIDNLPREIIALRPDRTRVVPGVNGWPETYEYTVPGLTTKISAERILHVKLFNPLDDYYGISPLEAAQRSIDTHNAANAWNKAMLDNAARPSGALVFSATDGQLSNDQFDRIKSELETSYQGAANAGRPMVLEGGLEWKEMGYSPKDMEFIEAKNMAAREIALAFGVPPMLLAIPGDNSFANYAEANISFWRQTVLPMLEHVTEALSNWLSEIYNQELKIKPDKDQVHALSADRDALWTRIEKSSFLSEHEKREAVGYSPIKPE